MRPGIAGRVCGQTLIFKRNAPQSFFQLGVMNAGSFVACHGRAMGPIACIGSLRLRRMID